MNIEPLREPTTGEDQARKHYKRQGPCGPDAAAPERPCQPRARTEFKRESSEPLRNMFQDVPSIHGSAPNHGSALGEAAHAPAASALASALASDAATRASTASAASAASLPPFLLAHFGSRPPSTTKRATR
eukprot:scaffold126677_cov48-Phaeocystis_antarctica.AAC.2